MTIERRNPISAKKKVKSGNRVEKVVGYKFYSVSELSLMALANGQIYLSHPSRFNDPFDSILRYDCEDNVGFRNTAARIMKKHRTSLNDEAKNGLDYQIEVLEAKIGKKHEYEAYYSLVKEWHDTGWLSANIWDEIKSEHGVSDKIKAIEILASQIGVFSVSKNCDIRLLWSHYARHHTGFCVEYELSSKKDLDIYKVAYNSDMPDILKTKDISDSNTDSLICERLKDQIIWKDKVWSYEKEYRIVSFKYSNQLIDLPGKIKKIIFGRHAKYELKKTLYRIFGETVFYMDIWVNDGQYQLITHPTKF